MNFICFDTEDNSKELLQSGGSGFDKVVTQIAAITAEGKRYHNRGDVAKFLEWLQRQPEKYIYAHNLQYDIGNLFSDKLVADYLFQKDRIFASLNLVDRELALYERLVAWLELDVVKPDIVVYLQAGTETLMDRIAHRNRPFEKDMERDYIARLNDAYNHYFFHYTDTPLLVVNTNTIDFVNEPDDYEDLVKRILSHHQGTMYYTPIEKGRST